MRLRRSLVLSLALLSVLGFASVWTVQQNQGGVRLRLGRPVGIVSSGLHLTLPFPIEQIVRVPTTEVRVVQVGVVLGSEPSTSFQEQEGETQWLTGDTNIVELRADVSYTVTDPIAYLYGFDGFEPGTTHVELIRAATESVLTRLLSSTTVESALVTGKIELSRRGLRETQEFLDELRTGVLLSALNISEVNPPRLVMRAFNDVSSAKADRDRKIAEAEGLSGTVLPRTHAEAGALVQSAHAYSKHLTSRATGEAASFLKLATEVAKSPQASRERFWLESIERILAKTDERVVPAGSRVYVGR